MVMGLDLVELQLRSAAGEALEDELGPLQGSGHAIEAEVRTSAAPPEPAEVTEMRWPPAPQGRLRVEPSVHPGSIVADSGTLLLKTTSYAPVRHQALLSLDRILAATVVRPLETNVPLLRAVLADEALRAGQYDTELLERLA
jgi:acetyl/propionyl-CoA carboxylase alpha subunit